MEHSEKPSSPYVGLLPYTEKDVAFFFGREVDTEVVTSNLRAAKLTLLYGGSGVGKSSLLNAGVAHHLRTISENTAQRKGAPEFIVAIFRDWIGDPVVGLSNCVQEAVTGAIPDLADVSVPPTRDLSQMLASWNSLTRANLFIILDQFEEYFQRPEKSTGEGSFAFEFPRAVARTGPAVKFLLSMRDDAVTKLDFFKGSIPGLLDNRLQVKHLDKQAAENAIRKPIAKYNELYGAAFEIEDELVQQVLKDVEVSNVRFSTEGQARAGGEAEQSRIETPYLQLVMMSIWRKEKDLKSKKLRLETLTRELGGSQKIVDTHLDDVMNALPLKQRKLAAKFVHFTVTRLGTKIATDAATLADWAELPGKETEIKKVLDNLGTGPARIYRRVSLQPGFGFATETTTKDVDFFEIYHDALIPSLLSWRKRYVEERNKQLTQIRIKKEEEEKRRQLLKEEEEKRTQLIQRHARQRRRAILIALGVILSVTLMGVQYYRITARRAERQLRIQKAYQGQLAYEISKAEILEYLQSKDQSRKNVGFNRLKSKAEDNAFTEADIKLFEEVLMSLPAEVTEKKEPVLKALQNSKPRAPLTDQVSIVLIKILYQDPSQHDTADWVKEYLEEEKDKPYSIIVQDTDLVGKREEVQQTELRYFHESDQDKAQEIVDYLKAIGINAQPSYRGGYKSRVSPNQFELWFSPDPISISESPP